MRGILPDRLRHPDDPRPERSLWLQSALDGETDEPALVGTTHADVAIVGGGYTGLWAALRVKELEPSARVVVIEADICGGGPSGRNGGFMDPWTVKFFALQELCGTEEAIRLCRLSVDAIAAIETFCNDNGVDAEIAREGGIWTAATASGVGSWEPTMTALDRYGLNTFRELGRDELNRLTGTDRFLGGVLDPEQGKVQPALLVRGLRRVALERGVVIHENTPMVRLERSAEPVVHTAMGQVRSKRLILAMGPWLGQLREVRNHLAVIATDMVATERIPDRLKEIGLDHELVISDSRMLINYYRTTSDGRIAWGKGGGSLAFGSRIGRKLNSVSARPDAVVRSLRQHYPKLADVRITHSWTGPVDRSVIGVPFFSALPDNPHIVCGAGYSGNGVVPSYLGGNALAAMALGHDDEYSSMGVVREPNRHFPPEPARWLGGMGVRKSLALAEAADDESRPTPLAARLGVKLAPPGPAEPR